MAKNLREILGTDAYVEVNDIVFLDVVPIDSSAVISNDTRYVLEIFLRGRSNAFTVKYDSKNKAITASNFLAID